ncbi:sigma-54 interaction domain-containing protein [Desulfitobacterium metallireducens]|uniref:ATPase AAA n=1 Tax=Desulfitobacterium metallireducens DSM 15288 TaxID=871968 RepID=W0ECW4_9FIRM|nr:ATPase AAA [Desulfitobacterium metallireducens DSM 15288]
MTKEHVHVIDAELLSAIINSTQDAISVVDEQGLGLLINPAYTRLTGLTADDVLGKPATVDIAVGESMHMQVLETGKAVKGVSMRVGPKRREVLVNVAPIIVEGKLMGSVAVIHDVSEIRMLSEELEGAKSLIRHLEAKYSFKDIIGECQEIREVIEQAQNAAQTPATVLLRGESGTGKELFAHAIHRASVRHNGQFIRVNCTALVENLLESELFGYVEGAFTGARRGGKMGLFEEANGGTLFLDEIGSMSLNLQMKLLRVLQEKELIRVGDNHPIPIDVRVIAATHVNLEEEIRCGRFREDLYYRLNVIPIVIPPLRQRLSDIPLLGEHLLRRFNQDYGRNVEKISDEAIRILEHYTWPGNVRELENVLGRAIISMKMGENRIEAHHLPILQTIDPLQRNESIGDVLSGHFDENGFTLLHRKWERELLIEVLQKTGGNKTKAAQLLKISLRNLYYKLERHGLGD